MARFGEAVYNDGTLYGEPSTDAANLWWFMVDWDGDGFFTGENEAPVMVDLKSDRGRDSLISANGEGFERYISGMVTITLDNTDGKYDPWNTDSPLYPNVKNGRLCRIGVKTGDNGTEYSIMMGKILNIQPYNTDMLRQVRIQVIDGQNFLSNKQVRIGIQHTPAHIYTTGGYVDLILERAGWPTQWPRTYDYIEDANGNSNPSLTDNFFRELTFYWAWKKNAQQAVMELESAELGTFIHNRDGEARFVGSHFRYDQTIEIDQADVLRDIMVAQPWEVVRNVVSVEYNPISLHATTTVWALDIPDPSAGTPVSIIAGQSLTFDVKFKVGDYTPAIVNEGLSFHVNTLADGSGTNITSSCSLGVVGGEVGDGATLKLVNNSAFTGYILDLSITGDPIYSPNVSYFEDNSVDVNSEDARVLKIESPWLQEFDWAVIMAQFLVEKLSNPTYFPTIKIEQSPDLQFNLDLYVDRIHFTSDKMNLNKYFRIGKISHSWLNQNGQSVVTTIKLEPYFALDAPVDIDYDLFNPFTVSTETNCTNPPAAGQMEWCLEEPVTDYGWNWQLSGGVTTGDVYCSLNGGTSGEASMYTKDLAYTIEEDTVLSFFYRWQDTDDDPPASQAILLTLTSLETGTIYSDWITFSLESSFMAWTQWLSYANGPNLAAWAGQTLSEIRFTLPASFTSAGGGLFRIDDIGLGRIIS